MTLTFPPDYFGPGTGTVGTTAPPGGFGTTFSPQPDGTLTNNQTGAQTGGQGAAPPPIGPLPIVAPTRTTAADAFSNIQQFIPEFQSVGFNPVGGITNTLDDDFFSNIESQATRRLNEQFFDAPDSLANRQEAQFNKRGLIGSGIEAGGQNQLFNEFGDQLVDLQSNLSRQRSEAEREVAFRNKEIEQENARQLLAAEQADRQFGGFLSELGLRASTDEAKSATEFDTGIFEQQVGQRGQEQEFLGNLMDTIGDQLGNEKLDKPFREFLRNMLGSNLESFLGPNRAGESSVPGEPGITGGTFDEFNNAAPGPVVGNAGPPVGEIYEGPDGQRYFFNPQTNEFQPFG